MIRRGCLVHHAISILFSRRDAETQRNPKTYVSASLAPPGSPHRQRSRSSTARKELEGMISMSPWLRPLTSLGHCSEEIPNQHQDPSPSLCVFASLREINHPTARFTIQSRRTRQMAGAESESHVMAREIVAAYRCRGCLGSLAASLSSLGKTQRRKESVEKGKATGFLR